MLERIKLFTYALRSAISTLSNPRRWLVEMFGGGSSKAGVTVNEDAAVKVTAVFACIRLLAQTIASLPLHTYRRVSDGKEKAPEHPLYFLLHSLPNEECTSYNFRLIMMVNLLLTGQAFAEIVRNRGKGEVKELWPIPTNKVYVKRNKHTKEIFYEVTQADGGTTVLYPENMLHIQWIGMENFRTFSPVALAREAIGLSIAAEEFGSRFFSEGANASGIAEYPGRLSDEAYERFKETFTEKYTGLNKTQRIMFLEQGLKFTKLTINPNEAQALETRKFQVIEVARFYNVPPHLIMDLEKATFSNIEHQDSSFVKYSLRPYLVCWEQEILRSLFLSRERQLYFAEFNVDGLLRGDTKARAEFYTAMFNIGVYSQNDIRAKENDNPFEGGDKHYVPLNMVAIEDEDGGPQENNGNPGRQEQQMDEQRANAKLNIAKAKYRTANNYRGLFADAARRVVAVETNDIRQKAKKALSERSQEDFIAWLENYYDVKFPEHMKRAVMPVLMAYAEAIQELAAKEVGTKAGMTKELEVWMRGYADRWVKEHSESSIAQLKAILRKANDEGLAQLEEIETRLEEWEEKRPDKIAMNETVNASGVISKFVYLAAGARYLRWINTSGDPCPYCQEMNGRIVGIDRPFVDSHDQLDSEDGVMKINKPAFTPPLHQGCQCVVVAD